MGWQINIATPLAKGHRQVVDDVKFTRKGGNLHGEMLSVKDTICLAWQRECLGQSPRIWPMRTSIGSTTSFPKPRDHFRTPRTRSHDG